MTSTSSSADLAAVLAAAAAEPDLTGPLAALLAEPDTTDVLVNGGGTVFQDRGQGLGVAAVRLPDEAAVRRLAVRLVASAGRRLDDAAPFADARLADGTRVHAVLPPVSPHGTCLSLRVPPSRTFGLDELVRRGSLPAQACDLVRAMVGSRLAFLVTGGTGSGKTTVLSSLLSLVEPDERIVLVEDCAELRPEHPHVVRLEVRPPNAEGAGGVTLAMLVRQALRMRPDRLVVGEVRGAEVLDLLAALNTGHDGGCGTVHANRAEQLPARIEALAVAASIPRAAAHSLLLAAVDAVVHLVREPGGRRRIAGVAVLDRGPDACATMLPAYAFGSERITPGPGADRLDRLLTRRR